MRRPAFSLVEILIVVLLMSVFAAAVIPYLEPNVAAQLESTAQVVVADLDYARHLAIANSRAYTITFDVGRQRYVLKDTQGRALPRSAFWRPGASADEQVVEFSDLPRYGPATDLVGVKNGAGVSQSGGTLTFDKLGALGSPGDVQVWLACGGGEQRRWIPVEVDPVTGVASVGEMRADPPAGLSP